MKKKPILSLVIPTHNSGPTIKALLNSINNSHFDSFAQIETIVVDDRSADNTLEMIKNLASKLKFDLKVFSLKRNFGPARARNVGVKKAKGKYALFLDADVELFKKSLKNAFEMARLGKVKAFTGIWHFRQKTKKFFPQFKALRDWGYWTVERSRNSRYYLFSTRIAGIEKKLFTKLGGFDESYREPTVEDIDLTYRIEKVAKIKFCPNIKVKHEFEDFLPIAVKYFKRSRDWITLYFRRLRFDPVATSKKEARKAVIAGFLIFSLLGCLFLPSFWVAAPIFFLIFAFTDSKFWYFLIKRRGFVFLLKSIPVSIILYLIIDLGALFGLLQHFKKASFKAISKALLFQKIKRV